MSTPFPLEQQSQQEGPGPVWDPWKGPAPVSAWKGFFYNDEAGIAARDWQTLKGLASGAALGASVLGGALHQSYAVDPMNKGQYDLSPADVAKAQKQADTFNKYSGGEELEQWGKDTAKRLAPDPSTTGTALQTIHSLAQGLGLMAAGGVGGSVGAAVLTGAAMGKQRMEQVEEQGASHNTALAMGTVQAITSGLGTMMPGGFGSTLLSRVTSGAGANVGLGLVNRYADHKILEAAGYPEMAAQQKVWDTTQVLTDGLMGVGFGALTHVMGTHGEQLKRAGETPGAEDAALVMNLANKDRASAPGVPADPGAAAAHDAALQTATAQLLTDHPVDVSASGVDRANFVPRPAPDLNPAIDLFTQVMRDSGLPGEEGKLRALEQQLAVLRGETPAPVSETKPAPAATIEPQAATEAPKTETPPVDRTAEIPVNTDAKNPLTPAQRDIETRFRTWLGQNYEQAKAAYRAIPDSQGGKILNTDTARELSPDYLADRTQSAAVHEPASWLMKQMYAEALAQPSKDGQRQLVLFTGGGTGSGKSTTIQQKLQGMVDKADVVYDTNFSGDSSLKKVLQALEVPGDNWDVAVAGVWRDPIEALVNGALTRASRQEREHGSGRTVPIKDHVDTHVGFNEIYRKAIEQFAGNDRVQFALIDNGRGRNNAAVIPSDQLPKLEYNSVHEQAEKELDRQFEAGNISAATYRGFAGHDPPASKVGSANAADRLVENAGPERPAVGEGPGGKPESQRDGGNAHPVGPSSAVYTTTGRRVEVAPRLVEAADLKTSDLAGYPQDLQPRQRGERVASGVQVADIAKRLNPELLGDSATADTGAPIVGPDNAVESGNGRVMALRDVYANNSESAAAYRAFLEKQGYDTAGMKEPVLVRERQTAMTPEERQTFAIEANKPTAARFSPVEQAQADAQNVGAVMMSKLTSGDPTTAGNAPFMRDFVGSLPMSERGELMGPDGVASQAGVRRAQGAILAKAYGGTKASNTTLGRLLESTDTDMKSSLNALQDAAPAFARLKQMIEDGTLGKEYDIAPAIVTAVEDVAKLRAKGMTLSEHLAQGDIFSPTALATKAFYDESGTRLVSRERAAKALMDYADGAMAQRLNQGNLFADKPVPPMDVMRATMAPKTTDMFGVRQAPKVAAKAAPRPAEISEPVPVSNGSAGAEFEGNGPGAGKGQGEPLLVARLSRSPELTNRNAGNLDAVAYHILKTEDVEGPAPKGGTGDTLFVHEVTPREQWGPFQRGNAGRMEGAQIGRDVGGKYGTAYSFPEGSKYDSKTVLSIPLEELRAELKSRTGTASFDDLGANEGGRQLGAIIKDRLEADRAATAQTDPGRQALSTDPNLAIAGDDGQPTRARAALLAADQQAQKTETVANAALTAAANCFGMRGA